MRVLPALEDALGPGVAEALARTAGLARADADALDALAADSGDCWPITGAPAKLDVAVLAELPAAVRRRVLRTGGPRGGQPRRPT